MNKEVLIFLHMDDEHPGHIADFLQQRNIPWRVIRSYQQEPIPNLDETIAGLAFMGGVMSANDDIDWLRDELRLIRQALDQGLPLLGHCLGGQLISKALGQAVTKNSVKEVGWHNCYRAEPSSGQDVGAQESSSKEIESWLGGIGDPFPMFHWHSETFTIPDQATRLFSSDHCENQAYSYRQNVLAMQCHVEMTLPQITHWIVGWKDDLKTSSASEQSYAEIEQQLADKILALNRVANRLYKRWASTLPQSLSISL